ncbi:sulfate/molybdate ABC transporter ATP-binding protein [Neisseria sp. Ec49-e6-T10]|uniref:sulfate/molybdate ABC transporter ATP-binding protein n=1 Tax=Neisseria sp. Ec49-e6-T10 TaxID=3140744 RepID=UPI003EBA1696
MNIKISNLNKHFGSFQALNNINLDIHDGELIALLGPSGCGKTTLLRIIAGLEKPDSGNILFDQNNVTQKHVSDRGVGFVFQHYALFRHMNVFDNVAFGLQVMPRSKRKSKEEIQEKVMNLLKLVQLDWLAKAYPNQLSGGQRQRIALARSLAVEPKVLLLDEPFGALDAKVRKDLRRWLRNLHHEINVTSIFVTHDQDEALEVADRVVVMNHGHIEQADTPTNIYQHPQTPFVTQFLGDVNVFHGRLEKGKLWISDYTHDFPQEGNWVDQDAIAYVRPHEIELSSTAQTGFIPATVCHLHAAGPIVRIEAIVTGEEKPIETIISQEKYSKERFILGDTIYLKPKSVNVFVEKDLVDFVI